jgi:hypothetical protein
MYEMREDRNEKDYRHVSSCEVVKDRAYNTSSTKESPGSVKKNHILRLAQYLPFTKSCICP